MIKKFIKNKLSNCINIQANYFGLQTWYNIKKQEVLNYIYLLRDKNKIYDKSQIPANRALIKYWFQFPDKCSLSWGNQVIFSTPFYKHLYHIITNIVGGTKLSPYLDDPSWSDSDQDLVKEYLETLKDFPCGYTPDFQFYWAEPYNSFKIMDGKKVPFFSPSNKSSNQFFGVELAALSRKINNMNVNRNVLLYYLWNVYSDDETRLMGDHADQLFNLDLSKFFTYKQNLLPFVHAISLLALTSVYKDDYNSIFLELRKKYESLPNDSYFSLYDVGRFYIKIGFGLFFPLESSLIRLSYKLSQLKMRDLKKIKLKQIELKHLAIVGGTISFAIIFSEIYFLKKYYMLIKEVLLDANFLSVSMITRLNGDARATLSFIYSRQVINNAIKFVETHNLGIASMLLHSARNTDSKRFGHLIKPLMAENATINRVYAAVYALPFLNSNHHTKNKFKQSFNKLILRDHGGIGHFSRDVSLAMPVLLNHPHLKALDELGPIKNYSAPEFGVVFEEQGISTTYAAELKNYSSCNSFSAMLTLHHNESIRLNLQPNQVLLLLHAPNISEEKKQFLEKALANAGMHQRIFIIRGNEPEGILLEIQESLDANYSIIQEIHNMIPITVREIKSLNTGTLNELRGLTEKIDERIPEIIKLKTKPILKELIANPGNPPSNLPPPHTSDSQNVDYIRAFDIFEGSQLQKIFDEIE